jgi:UDP-N-acetylmuramoyl-L-alanyl-D-glutamate--2,6-diaminopimelate ligase
MKSLSTLLQRLDGAGLVLRKQGPATDVDIDRLAYDSRKVGPGGLFIAIHGEKLDGHLFIDKAVLNGAIAIVCEAMPAEAQTRFPGIAFVQVNDGRAALAELAAAFYGDPSHSLKLIGTTGTNGKTTTTYLLHDLLTTLGETAGMLGTIEYRFGGPPVPATHTTPDALDLNRMLREMVDAGCTACAMEVSSHALAQNRVRALQFDVAIFTNLTRDHLDYHHSFQAYRSAKQQLFIQLGPEAHALYNVDDPAGPDMVAYTQARAYAYGLAETADFRAEVLENSIDGLRLRIDGSERRFQLVGLFNVYNLLAAYAAVRALGYPQDTVLDALAGAPPVPGRFEKIDFADGTTAIIDYAHTPDALENVLTTVRATKPAGASLWCIFGCGGDRDPVKRRIMGSIAERYADRVVVTSDNPRTEDPEAIMNEIRRGMDRPSEALWFVNRREAIEAAAAQARPGDVVLVAGKGHEPYQIIGTEKLPFDDREEVRRAFSART